MAAAVEQCDFVLTSAEVVSENGGLVAERGTLNLAIISKF